MRFVMSRVVYKCEGMSASNAPRVQAVGGVFGSGARLDSTLTCMSISSNDEFSFPQVDLILIDSVTRYLEIT